jgi:putative aminopeptidase FrvX
MTPTTFSPSFSAARVAILEELCSVPTAPFAEQAVTRYVERFVKARPKLRLARDRFGNLLIELPPRKYGRASRKNPPRWVFTAHTDHPGFVADAMTDARTLEAHFRGGVEAEYFTESRVRFFDSGGETTGTVTGYQTGEDGRPDRATLRVSGPVAPGTPGMWDQGPGRVRGKKFLSRVCDDLAGAAAALAMLDELSRKPPAVPVAVLLTRAEEVGFIGALAASIKPKLLRKSDRLIAIECSAAQPYAPQGKGAIVRIGDRTSVFNSSLSYFLTNVATELAKADKAFQYQRALMPGGTCEATVYDVYGFLAASICVPLGNYHNMDKSKKKIAPEFIDLSDWHNMVRLFLEVARHGHEYEPGHKQLKQRLKARFEKWRGMLGKGAGSQEPESRTK